MSSPSPLLYPNDPSSSTLHRNGSRSSVKSALVPSPRPSYANLNDPPSGDSSASGSRSGSFLSTPRILSRRNSTKDKTSGLFRKVSQRHVPQDIDLKSPIIEPAEVIETPHVVMDRDPGSGRKMINQYLVLNEIGHGTHGRVRLGQDLSAEEAGPDYYAIKIVDRNPKRKRLMGLARQRASNAGKLVNENEIRKEIAIFKKVNHPNVVRMREIIDDPDSSKLFMILEYCERGEVIWKAEEGGPALDLASIRRIFRQTVLGLEYLHHQGIIHRDIKPSNLLLSSDGTVKISDFGCSHYSEALRSSQLDGDAYVDDIELAKTAGSPAFFAPEMCYSGDLLSSSEGPAVTLRPPSMGSLEPGVSNDSSSARSSSTTEARGERLPITNAIDVWALGVTLYCLLFGRTPFDAANEYLLMQVIPLAEVEIPPSLARDRVLRTSFEGAQCLDLLVKLLEKDPKRRITLEKIKNHPFTLHGLSDPGGWLASTDPHAQSFVTVSNDEVAQVVVKSSSFREKFKRGVSNIANRLQIISSARNRSRSIGEDDSRPSAQRSAPPGSPASLARRLSVLGSPSPRRPEVRIPVDQPNLTTSELIPQSKPQRLGTSHTAPLRRRQSSDIDSLGRQRSPSSASSNSHLGSKLVRLLSRSGSQRQPPSSPRRMSSESHPARTSMETFESSSSVPPTGGHIREDFAEEVDWNETLSDDEDYTPALRPSAPNFGWQSEAEYVEDDGLAISLDSRRGRKGSMKL